MEIVKESKLENRNLLAGMIVKKSFHSLNRSLVVLANPKTVLNDRYAKKEVKEKVIRADQLITTIKKIVAESRMPSIIKKRDERIRRKFLEKESGKPEKLYRKIRRINKRNRTGKRQYF